MKKFFTVIAVVTALWGIDAGLHAQNDGSMKTKEILQNISAFPIGNENVAYQQYFTGKSWLARLATDKDLNVPISNVTFEPGCRNNWHSHTGRTDSYCCGWSRVLSGKREACAIAFTRQCGGDSSQCRTLARCCARQLVLAFGDRVQSFFQQKYMVRSGR